MDNIRKLVRYKLCFQCGACSVVCPVKCIKMGEKKYTGLIYPIIEDRRCLKCGLCLKVCPINNLKEPRLGVEEYPVINTAIYRACNKEIYNRASSGGFVTALIQHMLDSNIVTKAIVVEMDKRNPLCAKYVIKAKGDDLLASAGSKYQHPPLEREIFDNLNSRDKIVLVGLPCHIQGVLNIVKNTDHRFKGIDFYTIALLCTIGRGLNGTRYVVKKELKEKESNIVSVQYRNNTFPGEMTVGTKAGVKKIEYIDFLNYVDYLFMPKGCLFCSNLYGCEADISVGDPWGINVVKSSLVFYNNDKLLEVVQSAEQQNIIQCVKKVSKEEAFNTQEKGRIYKLVNYKKRLQCLKVCGVRVPNLGYKCKDSIKFANIIGNWFLFLNTVLFNSRWGIMLKCAVPKKLWSKYRSMILKKIN